MSTHTQEAAVLFICFLAFVLLAFGQWSGSLFLFGWSAWIVSGLQSARQLEEWK